MNFFSQSVPMDIDVNVPMHAVHVPMQIVPMHSVPKHVTFVSNYAVSNYAKPTQVVHYVYSNSMIIDEHPNKVILR